MAPKLSVDLPIDIQTMIANYSLGDIHINTPSMLYGDKKNRDEAEMRWASSIKRRRLDIIRLNRIFPGLNLLNSNGLFLQSTLGMYDPAGTSFVYNMGPDEVFCLNMDILPKRATYQNWSQFKTFNRMDISHIQVNMYQLAIRYDHFWDMFRYFRSLHFLEVVLIHKDPRCSFVEEEGLAYSLTSLYQVFTRLTEEYKRIFTERRKMHLRRGVDIEYVPLRCLVRWEGESSPAGPCPLGYKNGEKKSVK